MSVSNFEGHIDHSSGSRIFGWVRNIDDPNERLWVDLSLSSGWRARVLADVFRQDLVDHGIGDGKYGFEVSVPFEVFGEEEVKVTATIGNGTYSLMKSGRTLTPEFPLLLVAGDIVDNCNLRCPFCVTDYALTKGTKAMPIETFKKALPLLELVPDGMFWLSCMHEATVHPDFLSFVDLIPQHLRRKVSFTTNLCRKMSDDYLRQLAGSNLQAFRISIDSMDAETFGRLRKGGRLEVFLDNLKRLSGFMKEESSVTEIHFVTMAFKENVEEIEDVIRECRSIIQPARHEVRFMFYVPHASEWGADRILEMSQWSSLKKKVLSKDDLGDVNFYDPEPDTHQKFSERTGLADYSPPVAVFGGLSTPESYRPVDPREVGLKLKDEPLRLRLRWDGLLMMETVEEDAFRKNILDADVEYFLELRNSARGDSVVWQPA